MALREEDRHNFKCLLQAAKEGNLALLQGETKDGQYAAIICLLVHSEVVDMYPLARMASTEEFKTPEGAEEIQS